eukprot:TRINITY_DN13716_c1_g4_i1.p1 TRINITY_DN13716_c1_g4~~TRINITY_DN13716_c1_g4_i1.p1  ORF type:complete len:163 (+),score=17.34 TRINITY_DN13716_c1_g4_i1:138-626(+)
MGIAETSATSARLSHQARCFGSFFRSGSARRRICSSCEDSSGAGDYGLVGPSGKWVVEQVEPCALPRERDGCSANHVKNKEYLTFDDALRRLQRAKMARQAKRARRAEQAKQMRRMMDALVEGNRYESSFTNSRSDAVVVECADGPTCADAHSSKWPVRMSL